MKKFNFVPALVAAIVLVSCETEPQFNDGNGLDLSKDGIAFVFGGGKETKSADVQMHPRETGMVFSLGKDSNTEFFLNESVQDLNGYGPETKGTPIYTQNVTSFYNSFGAVTYMDDALYIDDVTFDSLDEKATVENREGWIYNHYYPTSPWPKNQDTKDLAFYLRMPTDHLGTYATDLDYADGTTSFSYTTPQTGEDQRDILFAYRTLNKKQYVDNYKETGAPVTFYHALTGVKFRSGSDNDGTTKTVIKQVKITGLKGSGDCTVASNGTVTWTNLAASEEPFSQVFANPRYNPDLSDPATNPDGTVGYTSGDDNFGGTSFITGKDADTQNLNDATASLTFWFVPQAFTTSSNVSLEITFVVKTPDTPNGTEITHVIEDFGGILGEAGVEWKAGQLRTYTLDPKDVDVDIFDSLERKTIEGQPAWVKSDLHVTNTGNVKEYVRMIVMGNWYGWESAEDKAANPNNPRIIVGYKYQGTESQAEVGDDWDENGLWKDITADYWVRDHDLYGTGFDATFFKGTIGTGNKWIRGTSGYYYPDMIGPGKAVADEEGSIDENIIQAGTTPLFESYTFYDDWLPTVWIPNPNNHAERVAAYDLHLVMEVVVQAIGAEKPDGTPYESCWDAWSAATGKTIQPK